MVKKFLQILATIGLKAPGIIERKGIKAAVLIENLCVRAKAWAGAVRPWTVTRLFLAAFVGVIPVVLVAFPDLVNWIITSHTEAVATLLEFYTLLQAWGGLASNVFFYPFQKLVEYCSHLSWLIGAIVGVLPAMQVLSPADLVDLILTQASNMKGVFNLHDFHTVLQACGGVAPDVTFSDFQKLVEAGYQDYMTLRIRQHTFAIPELLWTHQVCFNQLSVPMSVFNDCYIYTGIRELFITGNGAANTLLDIYTHLGQYIGGAPGMSFLEFESLLVEHFINFLKYISEAQGKEEAMEIAEEGVHLFKELKLSAEQLSRVLEAVAKL